MKIEKFVDSMQKQRYETLLDRAKLVEPNSKVASLFYIISSNDKLFEDANLIYNFCDGEPKNGYKRHRLLMQDKKLYNLALQLYDESLNHQSVHETLNGLDERNREIAITAMYYRYYENGEKLKKSPAKARDDD